MPYVINNPAVTGFQEGNRHNMQKMQMFENMLRQYRDNEAKMLQQKDQQTNRAAEMQTLMALGVNPISGQPYVPKTGNLSYFEQLVDSSRHHYNNRPTPAWAIPPRPDADNIMRGKQVAPATGSYRLPLTNWDERLARWKELTDAFMQGKTLEPKNP